MGTVARCAADTCPAQHARPRPSRGTSNVATNRSQNKTGMRFSCTPLRRLPRHRCPWTGKPRLSPRFRKMLSAAGVVGAVGLMGLVLGATTGRGWYANRASLHCWALVHRQCCQCWALEHRHCCQHWCVLAWPWARLHPKTWGTNAASQGYGRNVAPNNWDSNAEHESKNTSAHVLPHVRERRPHNKPSAHSARRTCCMCACVCMCVHARIAMAECMCVCTSVCMYVCMHVSTCVEHSHRNDDDRDRTVGIYRI